MKVQAYSLNDIFKKRLLLLIPFYIFSHEKNLPEYNSNEQKLKELKAGKLTIEEIAEYSELKVSEVEHLAGLQTV